MLGITVKLLILFIIFLLSFSPQVYSLKNLRVISLGPYITEDIFLLGAGDKLVGDTIYCVIPEAAKKVEKIGDIININIEKIAALKPDYVFSTGLTYPVNIEKMKKLGINVVQFKDPQDFNEICDQFIRLGDILGEGEKAREITVTEMKKVNLIKNKAMNLPGKSIY